MTKQLVIDALYQHRKGGIYWLIGVARPVAELPPHLRPAYQVMHSETEELIAIYISGVQLLYLAPSDSPKLVVYQAIASSSSKAPNGRWGRPLEMFVDGRFEVIRSTAFNPELEALVPKPCYYDPKIAPPAVSMHHCPVCGEMVMAGVEHT